MAQIAPQRVVTILSYSGSLAAGASVSGSLYSVGYARIIGVAGADASSVAGSGLRITQSIDGLAHGDYISACGIAACASAGGYSIEVVGTLVEVRYVNGATVASQVRLNWMLRPI